MSRSIDISSTTCNCSKRIGSFAIVVLRLSFSRMLCWITDAEVSYPTMHSYMSTYSLFDKFLHTSLKLALKVSRQSHVIHLVVNIFNYLRIRYHKTQINRYVTWNETLTGSKGVGTDISIFHINTHY